MTRARWQGLVGAILTLLLLAWTLRDVHPDELLQQLRGADIGMLLLAAIVATAIFPLRAMRWVVLLEPIAPALRFMDAWRAVAIGMMINNVLPARAGEFARAYALSRETKQVPFTSALASIALDRVFDALVVFALMFSAMLAPGFPAGAMIAGRPATALIGTWGVAILLLVFLGTVMIAFRPQVVSRIVRALCRRVAPRFESRVTTFVDHATAGLAVLRSPSRFARVVFWTVLHWLVNALAFWIAFRAVGITAPYSGALFLQGLIAIGVAIPSSPGFFGPFEAFAKTGLQIYGVPVTLAVTWAVGFHLLSFVP
ncbi:MAG TPA: lysylphosphatidylglycerol synthase transmembrane domain-containing protein, partial [Gemmatimonadaceae bacterium]|nr:lysylphosphatidylglycerol synthase transmembrane domain-containing protein [Gemmatimonadaceae bacterium]